MKRRGVGALLLLLISVGSLLAIVIHARVARAARAGEMEVVRGVMVGLPSSDLAWNGGARWVRFVSLEEPAAASEDGPLLPDPDPAGGLVSSPGGRR